MTKNNSLSCGDRRGFAIPTAILVIMVMTAALAAGFSLVSAENRSIADQKAQVTAFELAEQGLETFIVRRDSLGFTTVPPGAKDSTRITLVGGYADVSMDRIRAPQGSLAGLYVIRSRGVQTSGAYAGTPQGVRTVAEYALWKPASMQVLAGWTSISGVDKNGNSGTLGGIDACGDSAAVAGVAVPTYPGFKGRDGGGTGNPPVDSMAPTSDSLAKLVHMDWLHLSAGTAVKVDYTIPPAAMPTFADTTKYPVVRVVGDLTGSMLGNIANTGGRGLLIVTGNAPLGGSSFTWRGVVMIGGDLTGNGNNSIQGAVITALNVKLGQAVPIDTINGTKNYQYNSCSVANTMNNLGALIPLSNTWVDNWVEY
ncbi:MAG: hypothetical protein H0W63_02460 [Gemmatimonadaceae bacterium]|nr:hypothetical protein [Gemmatimonadaceae bacterium]